MWIKVVDWPTNRHCHPYSLATSAANNTVLRVFCSHKSSQPSINCSIKKSKCVKVGMVKNSCKTATTKQCCVTVPSHSVLIRFEVEAKNRHRRMLLSACHRSPSASQRPAIKWVNTHANTHTHIHTTATSGCGCLSFSSPPSPPLSLPPSRLISH